MLDTLISSKTRIKLLLKFFLNSNMKGYLRGLEQEFGESSNAIRVELNRLEQAGMLVSDKDGNKKFFRANTDHPLFEDVHRILIKNIGIDTIITKVIHKLGSIEKLFLVGELAKGKDSRIIDIALIGEVEESYLVQLIQKVENMIGRKIRYINYSSVAEVGNNHKEAVLLWSQKTAE